MAEKTFVLFEDNGDEKKINELASFLEGVVEWEGSDSGINLHPVIPVAVGDTIVVCDDGAVMVRRAAQ